MWTKTVLNDKNKPDVFYSYAAKPLLRKGIAMANRTKKKTEPLYIRLHREAEQLPSSAIRCTEEPVGPNDELIPNILVPKNLQRLFTLMYLKEQARRELDLDIDIKTIKVDIFSAESETDAVIYGCLKDFLIAGNEADMASVLFFSSLHDFLFTQDLKFFPEMHEVSVRSGWRMVLVKVT